MKPAIVFESMASGGKGGEKLFMVTAFWDFFMKKYLNGGHNDMMHSLCVNFQVMSKYDAVGTKIKY